MGAMVAAEASCATIPQLTTLAMAAAPHIGASADFFVMDKLETVDDADDDDVFAFCTTAAGTKASTATTEANTK
jgi:hypothetical protein